MSADFKRRVPFGQVLGLAWSCFDAELTFALLSCLGRLDGKGAQVGQVEFYFDLVSPYSYLAFGRVRDICEEHEADLVLRPMLLGAVHKTIGLQAPIWVPSKGPYQVQDVHRWAEHYGLPMRFPEPFPFRTLKSM